MAYCGVNDVRDITGLTTSEIGDDSLRKLIEYATTKLNADINIRRWDEHVLYIDSEKENTIDGVNTTFYVKYPYIGDADNDGSVDASDIIAYALDSESNRSSISVSSVDDIETGKITLASAPQSGYELYFCYYQAPLDENTPHPLIKQACIALTAAMAYQRIPDGSVKSFRLGNFSIVRMKSTSAEYYEEYYNIVRRILAKDIPEGVGDNEWL